MAESIVVPIRLHLRRARDVFWIKLLEHLSVRRDFGGELSEDDGERKRLRFRVQSDEGGFK